MGYTNTPNTSVVNNSYCPNLFNNNFGTRLTETQMRDKAFYMGFDFDAIWAIAPNKNDGYPYLRVLERTYK